MTKTYCSFSVPQTEISIKVGPDTSFWNKKALLAEYAEPCSYGDHHFMQITLPYAYKWQTLHPTPNGSEACDCGGHVWGDSKDLTYGVTTSFEAGTNLTEQEAAFHIGHTLTNLECNINSSIHGAGHINKIETSKLRLSGSITWGHIEGAVRFVDGCQIHSSEYLTAVYDLWKRSFNGDGLNLSPFESFTATISDGHVNLITSDSRSGRPEIQFALMSSKPVIIDPTYDVAFMSFACQENLRTSGHLSGSVVTDNHFVEITLQLLNREVYSSIEEVHATYCHCECECPDGGGN